MTPSNISHAFYSEKVSPSNDSKQKDDNGDMNGMSAKLLNTTLELNTMIFTRVGH